MKDKCKIFPRLTTIALSFFIVLSGWATTEKVAIIDAGSSGSRLFVYEINASDSLPVKQVYPLTPSQQKRSKGRPLSSIADHPDSVRVFLQTLTEGYPCDGTPLYVFATAGMRLQPKEHAAGIYKKLLQQPCLNGYTVKAAMTISGQYEGLYGWLAANYENGKISLKESEDQLILNCIGKPYGILEIGGASLQLAFDTHHAGRHCLYREGLGYIFCKSYLGAGVDRMYKHTKLGKRYKFDYDFGRDYSMWYAKTRFLGLGIPVNIVIEGVEAQTDKKSYKSKIKAYVNTLDDFVDSEENYHPRMNAHYIRWVSHQLHLDDRLEAPQKDASWTIGAALDIVVNHKRPMEYDHDCPN